MGETANRILFGVLIATLAICTLAFDFWHRILAVVLVALFSLLGVNEFFRLTDRGYEGRPLRTVGYVFSALLVLCFYAHSLAIAGVGQPGAVLSTTGFPELLVKAFYPGTSLAPLAILLFVMSTLVFQLLLRPLDGSIYSVSVTVFGVLYACLPFTFVFLILSVKSGVFYLIYFIVASEMTDAGAYFAGRWFGKHNAGLQASPKKTYEGYIGGIVVANILAHGLLAGWHHYAPGTVGMGHWEIGILTFAISMVTIFGDLTESVLKRDARIKDSASIIPGHGGILDLVDALLFVLPLGYLYLHYKQSLGFPV